MRIVGVENRLRREFPGVVIILGYNPKGYVYIANVTVPKARRNQGIGTKIMQRLHDLTDLPITLNPTSEFGSNLKRLKTFYRRLGYADICDGSMRREPSNGKAR